MPDFISNYGIIRWKHTTERFNNFKDICRDSDTEASSSENESEKISFQIKNYHIQLKDLDSRIPKIFLFSKSDYVNLSKCRVETLNVLVRVFRPSSFFWRFSVFDQISHWVSTDVWPWTTDGHLLSPTVESSISWKNTPSKKSSFWKKWAKNPPSSRLLSIFAY